MKRMKSTSVTRLNDYEGRVSRAMAARRRLPERAARTGEPEAPRGRAWINGHELGGTDARVAHLAVTFD